MAVCITGIFMDTTMNIKKICATQILTKLIKIKRRFVKKNQSIFDNSPLFEPLNEKFWDFPVLGFFVFFL